MMLIHSEGNEPQNPALSWHRIIPVMECGMPLSPIDVLAIDGDDALNRISSVIDECPELTFLLLAQDDSD